VSERSILHVDMDAFFVSVELLDRPELRGKPVIVGGAGDRGVVAAASYEARAYGIASAMPSVRARRLCPHAVFLPGRYDRYAEVSQRVMEIFRSYTPLVEPLSLDEAFLDVTGARRLHGPAPEIAAAIRARVLAEEGLTCSVGVAPTKFVAKLASEAAKPIASVNGPQPGIGVKVVGPDEMLDFLHPLPVQALWGVGPKTWERLHRLGVVTVGDLASMSLDVLVGALGTAQGRHLHALANGIDDRAVEPDRVPKSIGHEETFPHDHHRLDTLQRELVRMADAVAARLRAHSLAGRTITLKVRFHDFRTITRSVTLGDPTDSSAVLVREGRSLLAAIDPTPGVRLLGLSVSSFVEGGARQLSFDELGSSDGVNPASGSSGVPSAEAWAGADRAVDQIRARFGRDAIGPASIVDPAGLRIKRRGDQQWGPGASEGQGEAPATAT
jgi:DNA polymerase-4